MNSVNDVSIIRNGKKMVDSTQQHWLCSAPLILTKQGVGSEPASTTEHVARAAKKASSLKPSDPYPTWPFTQVNPRSLARWCKKNVALHQIEEAPY